MQNGWYGFDLDGTLAHYTSWVGPGTIGAPIPAMLARLKEHLTSGHNVKIVTARACRDQSPEDLAAFYPSYVAWCKQNIGTVLPVTAEKDYRMIRLYDDRCVAVEQNTGRILGGL